MKAMYEAEKRMDAVDLLNQTTRPLLILIAPRCLQQSTTDIMMQPDPLSDNRAMSVMTHSGTGLSLCAIATPVSLPEERLPQPEVMTQYVLSRFVYCHSVDGHLRLESPLSPTQIVLLGWQGAALFSQITHPHSCQELATLIPGVSLEAVQHFFSLLLSARMLSVVEADGTVQEDVNVTLAQWEFHDLLFHTRSRQGRHLNPSGGTYRFLGKIAPTPAIKPPMSEEVIDLYKPNLETLKTLEAPFTQILEARQSIRDYGEAPITAQQLGAFLYRCARVKSPEKLENEEITLRPYPSEGALYELELYPVINKCEDIAAGLYHYEPLSHQLCRVANGNTIEGFLTDAQQAMGSEEVPQVLIIIAARFQRMAWKYESTAYASILKHVGVLYQTMYLVATAMELAPCALGSGNSDLFAQTTGCDYYIETSVGEFALGSQPKA
jgi:oxazoline/thiazoline dehydrogenase